MKRDHISFDEMSDLYDNLIPTEEEKDIFYDHFEACHDCGAEYDRLRRTVCHLAMMRDAEFELTNLSDKTIKAYMWRRRKQGFLKAMPAVAASLFVIAGAGIFSADPFMDSANEANISNKYVSSSPVASDTEKVIKILGDHDARILKISDLYIEGEISLADFKKLRRDLGFRKVVYTLTNHSGSNIAQSGQWKNNNIEEVGINSGGGRSIDQRYNNSSANSNQIRFRVFK